MSIENEDLRADLVILSNEENSYSNPLYLRYPRLSSQARLMMLPHRHNDIFIVNSNNLAAEDMPLFCRGQVDP